MRALAALTLLIAFTALAATARADGTIFTIAGAGNVADGQRATSSDLDSFAPLTVLPDGDVLFGSRRDGLAHPRRRGAQAANLKQACAVTSVRLAAGRLRRGRYGCRFATHPASAAARTLWPATNGDAYPTGARARRGCSAAGARRPCCRPTDGPCFN